MDSAALRLSGADPVPLAGIRDHPWRTRVVDSDDIPILAPTFSEAEIHDAPGTHHRRAFLAPAPQPRGRDEAPDPMGLPQRDRSFDRCAAGVAGVSAPSRHQLP